MLRAYVVAGRPDVGCRPWGSFEAWSSLVAPAIVFAGGTDPMLARPADTEGRDPEKAALVTLLETWPQLAPDGATAKSVLDRLYPTERLRGQAPRDAFEGVREAIESVVSTHVAGRAPDAKALGKFLGKHKARVVRGRRFVAMPAHAGTVKWRVEHLGR